MTDPDPIKEPKLSYLFASRFNAVEERMISELERVHKVSKNTVLRRGVRLLHAQEARKAAKKRV